MPALASLLQSLALAAWFGGGIATALATSAIFARAESRKQAGDLAGAVLARTNQLRIAAAALLALSALLGARGLATWLGGACLVLQLAAIPLDTSIRRIRRELGGAVEQLDAKDPRRKRFGALHGLAMLLLLAQVVLAGAGLAAQ